MANEDSLHSVPRIDAHQHFWRYQSQRDAWITEEMAVIRRDFMPEDLRPLLDAHGFDGCVAVQADQSEAETFFLLDLAARFDFIKGVVGWIDLQAADVVERLTYFRQYPKLKGFRHIVQDEADRFLLRPGFLNGIEALGQHDYVYDILIRHHQLADAIEFVGHFPQQRFVIDHLAKPAVSTGERQPWARHMEAIAQHTNVYCKLSGMLTEADLHNWSPADFSYYINHIVNVFGADRIMFGSDWPVCLLAGGYGDTTAVVEHALARLPRETHKRIWRDNAMNFYNL